MRILTLDAYLHGPDVVNGYFRSPDTIFEYDAVFWDPANTLETYRFAVGNSHYKGHPRIADHETTEILQDIIRRRKEFTEFLEMGRTVAIFIAPDQHFWFDTGNREKSGTGKNQKVTTILDSMELAEKVVPGRYKVTAGQGTRLTARQSSFRALLNGSPGRWWYRGILEEFPGEPLAVVSGTSKCVGAIHRNKKGGLLLLLPDFVSPEFPFTDEDVEEAGADSSDPEARLQEATEAEAANDQVDQASVELIAWLESLRAEGGEAPPAWLHRYRFAEDVATTEKLTELEEKKSKLVTEIDELKSKRELSDHWKRLIYATGDELEGQVIEAFRLLGFEATRGPEGRADIVLKLDTQRAVVEVKGLTGSAAEKNAAQLEKWISEEMLSGSGKAKGILVVNAYRQTPPDARSNPSFPHQMVTFSTPREHCLLTTVQLLAMVRTVMEDPSMAPSIANQLLSTTGEVAAWNEMVGLRLDS